MAIHDDKNTITDEDRKRQLFAELQKLRLVDLNLYPYRTQQQIIGTFKREDLKKYLQAPELEANQKQLRKISRFLNNASTQYKRLLWYFSNLLTFDYYIEPYGIDIEKVNKKTFKKSYLKTVDLVESMNLKHELNKVMQTVFKDGIFYGYIHMGKDSFFIQELDADYCKITFIDDGIYGFSFNFSYFFTYPERLEMYPQEFKDIYHNLAQKNSNKKSKNTSFWVDLDIENTICIKSGSEYYPIPPFVGVFEDILNISDFKALQKSEEELGNYKLLFQKIPMDVQKNGAANQFLITEDFVRIFHDNIEASLPDQVGLITSPMEVTDITFERDKTDKNKVSEATKQYWHEAGVSQLLFSGDTTGSIGLNLSVKTDEMIAFHILRQLERWLNRYLKKFNSSYNFRVRMPEITWLNQKEKQDSLLSQAQYGLPVKIQLIASTGMQPSTASNMSFLENEILGLQDNFKYPLVSSHTTPGGQDGAGAPPKDPNSLSDAGTKTVDTEANQNRS